MTGYTVALSGLDESSIVRVRNALDRNDVGTWSLGDAGDADLLIVDVDSVWGHMDWLKATAAGQRTAAFTTHDEVRDCELTLQKPLDEDALAALLCEVAEAPAIAPATVASRSEDAAPENASAEPVAPADAAVDDIAVAPVAAEPASPPVADVAPETVPEPTAVTADEAQPQETVPAPVAAQPRTVAELLLAGGIEGTVTAEGDGVALVIDGAQRMYQGPAQLKPLGPLLSAPVESLTPVAGGLPPQDAPAQPLARLAWFAALTATPGTLQAPLDAQTTYRLTRWPQIEREYPRHFRIATAMMKQAGSVGDIASLANVPTADVVDFINAYHVAGYVVAERDEPAAEVAGSTRSRFLRPFSRAQEPG